MVVVFWMDGKQKPHRLKIRPHDIFRDLDCR